MNAKRIALVTFGSALALAGVWVGAWAVHMSMGTWAGPPAALTAAVAILAGIGIAAGTLIELAYPLDSDR